MKKNYSSGKNNYSTGNLICCLLLIAKLAIKKRYFCLFLLKIVYKSLIINVNETNNYNQD